MRAPILFYVARYRGRALSAVPVHVVDDTGSWRVVRPLAGRYAGGTITIVPSDLHHSPGSVRLVPGSREAIERYGLRQLVEARDADALRKRIGSRRLTDRRLQSLFDEMMELAARVRRKMPGDISWRFFDRDLEALREGRLTLDGARLVAMLDLVRGAASRWREPPVDKDSAAYARAVTLSRQADAHAYALGGAPTWQPGVAPAEWVAVADAYEVVEDAWREAGDEERADDARTKRDTILIGLSRGYTPKQSRPR